MSTVTFNVTGREGISSVVVRFNSIQDENTPESETVEQHTTLSLSPSDIRHKLSDSQAATVSFTASGLNTSTPTITITKLYFSLVSTPKAEQFLDAEEWTRTDKVGGIVCAGCSAPVKAWADWVSHRSTCHAIEKMMAMAVFREIDDIIEAQDKEGKCPSYKQPKDTVADAEASDNGLGELKTVKNSRRHSLMKMFRRTSGVFTEATNHD
ncbi:hypothetical protein CPB85DRAFT_1568990 [Mucidula mucida]|nr:hypothetical protein CPB85DRAFT_1568990 [Mucidula mucida]